MTMVYRELPVASHFDPDRVGEVWKVLYRQRDEEAEQWARRLNIEVRERLDWVGYEHVRIVVSGGKDPARIMMFRERSAPVDAYGIGSAISGAPPIDFTADIKVIEGQPVAKRGRIPGITPNPRLKGQRVDK